MTSFAWVPAWTPAVILLVAAAALLAFGLTFYRRQAEGGLGGRISLPKTYWLCFAVFFWFALCPAVALDVHFPPLVRLVATSMAISMWLRGTLEMVMLYRWKNWRPPYGVGHDILCIVLIAGCVICERESLLLLLEKPTPLAIAGLGFIVALVASLLVEIHHAASFHAAVAGRTTGDNGVWFADEDARFVRINRVTRQWNYLLTGWVLLFLLGWAAHGLSSAVEAWL